MESAEEETPKAVFATAIGVLGRKATEVGEGTRDDSSLVSTHSECVGDADMARRSNSVINQTLEPSIVTSWDGLGMFWHHTFLGLLEDLWERLPLLTEIPHNFETTRERMNQFLF